MPEPNWRTTLADVERSIGDCLETLDRYEAAFARVLASGEPASMGIGRIPEMAPLLEAKLAEADRTTDDVERLLAEQDTIWTRWRDTLATWHGLINSPEMTLRDA
jgi:hypothetical protein